MRKKNIAPVTLSDLRQINYFTLVSCVINEDLFT